MVKLLALLDDFCERVYYHSVHIKNAILHRNRLVSRFIKGLSAIYHAIWGVRASRRYCSYVQFAGHSVHSKICCPEWEPNKAIRHNEPEHPRIR